jgi:hypothetical protein
MHEARCFGVDHWRGDEHSGPYDEEVYEELRAYHDPLYSSFSTLLRMSFDDGCAYFHDGTVDLLHIDGHHTYEAVSHDFSTWLPKMSDRGIVMLHDSNVRERGFGIWRFWAEIAQRYPSLEFVHQHGLGVVYVGSEELSPDLAALFAADAESDISKIRAYFGRLGISIYDRYERRVADESTERFRRMLLALGNRVREQDHANEAHTL